MSVPPDDPAEGADYIVSDVSERTLEEFKSLASADEICAPRAPAND